MDKQKLRQRMQRQWATDQERAVTGDEWLGRLLYSHIVRQPGMTCNLQDAIRRLGMSKDAAEKAIQWCKDNELLSFS